MCFSIIEMHQRSMNQSTYPLLTKQTALNMKNLKKERDSRTPRKNQPTRENTPIPQVSLSGILVSRSNKSQTALMVIYFIIITFFIRLNEEKKWHGCWKRRMKKINFNFKCTNLYNIYILKSTNQLFFFFFIIYVF